MRQLRISRGSFGTGVAVGAAVGVSVGVGAVVGVGTKVAIGNGVAVGLAVGIDAPQAKTKNKKLTISIGVTILPVMPSSLSPYLPGKDL